MRVLAPRGVAYVKAEGRWTKSVKPWPEGMDEWTHFLHDAGNNAVAKDSFVGPPKRMQWVSKPLYLRSHEIDSSMQAIVSGQGRFFYIHDEELIGITDERLPSKWVLAARDAFNGVLLWKRPIPEWGWREWKRARLEGKDWTALRGQRGSFPAEAHRRLVVVRDRLYVTLGYRAPLSMLDAATGKVLETYEGTECTDEVLFSDGLLVIRRRDLGGVMQQRRSGKPFVQRVAALDPKTGKMLWEHQTTGMVAMSLAARRGRVCFHNRKEAVCLDMKSGKELWRTSTLLPDRGKKAQPKKKKRPSEHH